MAISLNFKGFSGPKLAVEGGSPLEVDSEARVPVGTRATDTYGNEYIYLPGVASVVAGDAVTYNGAYATARAVADAVGNVAVFQAPVVAGTYGWACIKGRATVNVAAGLVANAQLFLTSTPGELDDAAVEGDIVLGAFSATAIDDDDQADVFLNYPCVTNVLPDGSA